MLLLEQGRFTIVYFGGGGSGGQRGTEQDHQEPGIFCKRIFLVAVAASKDLSSLDFPGDLSIVTLFVSLAWEAPKEQNHEV